MSDYQKSIFIAAISGVILAMSFMNSEFAMMLDINEDICLSDCILAFGLGAPYISRIGILRLAMRMFPLYLFQFLFGCYMYRHFCSSGVYYFTRQLSRSKWYWKEILRIFVQAVLFSVLLPITGIVVITLRSPVSFDRSAIMMFVLYMLINTLWLFSTTLAINIIAIKLGSNWGFLIIGGIQILGLSLLLIFEKIDIYNSERYMEQAHFLVSLNPIAHLVLGWHQGIDSMMQEIIMCYQENTAFQVLIFPGLSFSHSVFLLFCISVVLISIGNIIIQKQEFLINNFEIEGE